MAEPQEKILVIKLGALGDFIQALGPMAAIRHHHKNAHITLLTTAPFADLTTGSGFFDDIHIDVKPRWFNVSGWRNLKKFFNESGFSRIYDLQNSDRTSLYFRLLTKKNRLEWVGAAKGASHRNESPGRVKGHAFDGHVQTLGLAGITGIKIDRLEWMQADLAAFPLRRPCVLLVPGASPARSEKRWPAENYARLAKILAQWGYQPVILGTKHETGIAKTIIDSAPAALDLTGCTTLPQLAVMARAAAACIGNDSGPLHLVAATGCPCLALFSGTSDPVKHAPRGAAVTILKSENLETLKVEKVLQLFKPREEPPDRSGNLH